MKTRRIFFCFKKRLGVKMGKKVIVSVHIVFVTTFVASELEGSRCSGQCS